MKISSLSNKKLKLFSYQTTRLVTSSTAPEPRAKENTTMRISLDELRSWSTFKNYFLLELLKLLCSLIYNKTNEGGKEKRWRKRERWGPSNHPLSHLTLASTSQDAYGLIRPSAFNESSSCLGWLLITSFFASRRSIIFSSSSLRT